MNALTSKYPSQTTLLKIYGFNKYQLGDKMRNNMHIPDDYLMGLSKYRIIHMTGDLLKGAVDDGMILENGINYAVIYHNCTPFAAKRAKEVRLSFRAAQDEFKLEPIVLVQIVEAMEGE